MGRKEQSPTHARVPSQVGCAAPSREPSRNPFFTVQHLASAAGICFTSHLCIFTSFKAILCPNRRLLSQHSGATFVPAHVKRSNHSQPHEGIALKMDMDIEMDDALETGRELSLEPMPLGDDILVGHLGVAVRLG